MRQTTALLIAAVIAAAGCNEDKSTKVAQGTGTMTKTQAVDADQAEVKANLAQLSPEDRALAEKQKYCVEQSDELLGSMGKPIKLTIKGETVFVCCKSCEKHAQETRTRRWPRPRNCGKRTPSNLHKAHGRTAVG